jgi:uncharacterized protein YbcV (DUF1398 family)
MDATIVRVLDACTRGSDDGTVKFPEIVGRLAAAGVEQYHADLRRAEKTYYLPGGDSHVCPAEPVAGPIAEAFEPAAVAAAVRASQAGTIDYPAFLVRIAAAGCTSYFVSIIGRRALYLGRGADYCVEYFPPKA